MSFRFPLVKTLPGGVRAPRERAARVGDGEAPGSTGRGSAGGSRGGAWPRRGQQRRVALEGAGAPRGGRRGGSSGRRRRAEERERASGEQIGRAHV